MLTPIIQLANSKYYINNYGVIQNIIKKKIKTLAFKEKRGPAYVYTSHGTTVCFILKKKRFPKLPKQTIWIIYKGTTPELFKDRDTIHLQFCIVDAEMTKSKQKVTKLEPKYNLVKVETEPVEKKEKAPETKSPTFIPSFLNTPKVVTVKTKPTNFLDIGDANALYRRNEKRKLLKDASTGIKTKGGNLLLHDVPPQDRRPRLVDEGVGDGTPAVIAPNRRLQDEDDVIDLEDIQSQEPQATPQPRPRPTVSQTPMTTKRLRNKKQLRNILENLNPFPSQIYNFFPLFFFLCNDFRPNIPILKENVDEADNWTEKIPLPVSMIPKAMQCQTVCKGGLKNYLIQFDKFNKFVLARHVIASLRDKDTSNTDEILDNYNRMKEMITPNYHQPVYYKEFLLPILHDLQQYYHSIVPFGTSGWQVFKPNINKRDVKIHTTKAERLAWDIPWVGQLYEKDRDHCLNFKRKLKEETTAAQIPGGTHHLNHFRTLLDD
jgi:hypothetical protein